MGGRVMGSSVPARAVAHAPEPSNIVSPAALRGIGRALGLVTFTGATEEGAGCILGNGCL